MCIVRFALLIGMYVQSSQLVLVLYGNLELATVRNVSPKPFLLSVLAGTRYEYLLSVWRGAERNCIYTTWGRILQYRVCSNADAL